MCVCVLRTSLLAPYQPLTRMRKRTVRPRWAVLLNLYYVVLALIFGIHEQDGEDKIHKVLDLLDHDVCTVIVGVLQR